ncbi:hypothetical protein [Streptomyces sp. NPDC021356]|uniref:hypothetical protein n=1 Tax=Streptomyces sp. NPDC021356 TaxID=3154900 RepID=UPI00340E05F6
MNRHRAHLPALSLALLLPLTACAVTDTGPTPAGSPATGLRDPRSRAAAAVHVYFYSAQGLERVSRPYRGPDAPNAALRQLVAGPNTAERARGLISYAPHNAPTPAVTAHRTGALEVTAPQGWESRSALRQLVCTAADVASAAEGASIQDLRVTVHRAEDRDALTQGCQP